MVYGEIPDSKASYDLLHSRYREPPAIPDDFTFPTHVIDNHPPQLLAIHWVASDFSSERKLTYGQLSEASKRAAYGFHKIGFKRGDRVIIQLPRVPEWWIVFFGLVRVGIIPIPVTSLLVGKDLKQRALASGAVGFVGSNTSTSTFESGFSSLEIKSYKVVQVDSGAVPSNRIDFARVTKDLSPIEWDGIASGIKTNREDLAMIYFTSGTTGMPKMVLLDHSYTFGHFTSSLWYKLSPGKLFLSLSDLGWAKASYATFGTFISGATLFAQPPPSGAGFDSEQLLRSLTTYGITTLCAPPTVYRTLLSTENKKLIKNSGLQALEHCVGAGEPLNPSVVEEWKELTGLQVYDGYGQTETVMVISNHGDMKIKPGSMGKPTPGFEIEILAGTDGPSAKLLEAGEEGEICIRRDTGLGKWALFRGYSKGGKIDRKEVTTKDGKVWYCTGDRGFKDNEGYFHFVGRTDDVITSSGYRIGPFEVESTLKEYQGVLESAVVASPDLSRGEIVKAFIIPTKEYENRAFGSKDQVAALVKEIQDFCKSHSAAYKYPREIEFTKELPKTVSGKISRVVLRNEEYRKKADTVKAIRARL